MDKQSQWTRWLPIAVIVIVAGVALVMTTLAGSQTEPYPQTQASQPPASTAPSENPGLTVQPASASTLTANASQIGYAGPVLVRLTLSENGSIEALDIGGARFQETEGLGGKVRGEDFIQPFIGKTPPLTLGEDIDAISGATLSSTAAVEAVNDAALFIAQMQSASDTN